MKGISKPLVGFSLTSNLGKYLGVPLLHERVTEIRNILLIEFGID